MTMQSLGYVIPAFQKKYVKKKLERTSFGKVRNLKFIVSSSKSNYSSSRANLLLFFTSFIKIDAGRKSLAFRKELCYVGR